MKKFSITIANYNNAQYLSKAIESVLNQTYPHWELVIVDDKSTDNSIEVIQPYLINKSIHLIKHSKNMGAGSANKTAIEYCNGEIIGRLDADDVLAPEALEVMMQLHRTNPQASLIYSTYYSCDEKLSPQVEKESLSKPIPKNKSAIHGIYITHFSTFKKKLYQKTKTFSSN
ncbi:MAG: glycosyltransferase [Thermoflexibacter sp.]|nr:glycosyltransferase [Thermoflexibacter sp.]